MFDRNFCGCKTEFRKNCGCSCSHTYATPVHLVRLTQGNPAHFAKPHSNPGQLVLTKDKRSRIIQQNFLERKVLLKTLGLETKFNYLVKRLIVVAFKSLLNLSVSQGAAKLQDIISVHKNLVFSQEMNMSKKNLVSDCDEIEILKSPGQFFDIKGYPV